MTYYDQKLIRISLWLETFCKDSDKGYITYEEAREGFERYGFPIRKDSTLRRQMREASVNGLIGRGRMGKEAIFFPLKGGNNVQKETHPQLTQNGNLE